MPSISKPPAYLLSYRSQDKEEDRRLDSQHDVIKHAILDGHLVHPAIPVPTLDTSIADIACGTGIWLEDVRKTYFGNAPSNTHNTLLLVGFDINSHAFDSNFAPTVRFVEQDCTKEFPVEYHEKFDLVNMRGLAYAIPRDGFASLISNAVKLLRPGGHLQWLETDTRLFKQFPVTSDFKEAIEVINAVRRSRNLVVDMPTFMLQELLQHGARDDIDVSTSCQESVSILHFNLLPGGICRDPELVGDELNRRFSRTILESVKLLLAPALDEPVSKQLKTEEEKLKISRLMTAIASSITVDEVTAGGIFPHVVAQKTKA